MNKKQKKMLTRILIVAVMMVVLELLPTTGILRFVLYMIPYLVIGYDILRKAFRGILNRRIFDENFLMVVATLGAIAVGLAGTGDYTEAIAVMLFYQIGELFQSYAVGKSRKNISELMDIRPDYANVEQEGELVRVDPDEVAVGTEIIVQPGEKVPIDGIVVEGYSTLNTSALTGESLPREIVEGEEIISGCINMSGLIKVKTTKGVWRIYGIEDSGTGGEFHIAQIQIGSVYHEICQILYAGRLLRCIGFGASAAACQNVVFRASGGLGNLGIPCPDISCDQLSVRAGHQYSA